METLRKPQFRYIHRKIMIKMQIKPRRGISLAERNPKVRTNNSERKKKEMIDIQSHIRSAATIAEAEVFTSVAGAEVLETVKEGTEEETMMTIVIQKGVIGKTERKTRMIGTDMNVTEIDVPKIAEIEIEIGIEKGETKIETSRKTDQETGPEIVLLVKNREIEVKASRNEMTTRTSIAIVTETRIAKATRKIDELPEKTKYKSDGNT